jgi:hypothetical protein
MITINQYITFEKCQKEETYTKTGGAGLKKPK